MAQNGTASTSLTPQFTTAGVPPPRTVDAMTVSGKAWGKRLSSCRRREITSIVHDWHARRMEPIVSGLSLSLPDESSEDEDRMMEEEEFENEPEPVPAHASVVGFDTAKSDRFGGKVPELGD